MAQNVKWANDLGMPVLLQEAGYLTDHNKSIKDRFYQQMIHNFYNEGGDGLLFWTLNHDDYYYSTDINGTMDDGYGFYLSDDAFLRNKSQAIMDAINFTKYDNNGGSWIKELNNYKYDFVLNIGLANNITIDNCSLYLNISNGTWSGYSIDQLNSSPITYNNDYTFIKQFDDNAEEFYWYTQCCGDSSCINSTPTYVQVKLMTPSVSLESPDNNTFHNTNTLDLIYHVTNEINGFFLDISYCELYINNNLNKTDNTISRGVDQSFSVNFPDATYNQYIKCTDIDDNIGTSEIKTFTIDTGIPALSFIAPSPNDGSAANSTSPVLDVSVNDSSNTYAFFDDGLVGWWRLEANMSDESGNNNHGTCTNCPAHTTAGKFGKAFVFDGVDDGINAGNNSNLNFDNNTDFTISTWIKTTSKTGGERIICKRGVLSTYDFLMHDAGNGQIQFYMQGTEGIVAYATIINTDVADGNWHHVVAVVNWADGKVYAYLDGQTSLGGIIIQNGNIQTSSNITIGKFSDAAYKEFNGTIDEVLIFNRTLSATEIQALYNSSQYYLQRNLTDLDVTSHSYTAQVVDAAGNRNPSTLGFAVVLYDEFSGDTTDLSDINISNITNLIIDQPSHGKIDFNETIDLSAGADINSYVNISLNRIEINSSALPVLNNYTT
ncbi:hypothetical protein ES703_102885 [subsurface metagenome]